MKAVAAGDEVTNNFVPDAISFVANLRERGIEIVNREIVHFKHDLSAGFNARLNKILDHFLLRINRDGAAAGQVR